MKKLILILMSLFCLSPIGSATDDALDFWCGLYFGTPSNHNDRIDDTDGDGWPNYAEFTMGTNPNFPWDFPKKWAMMQPAKNEFQNINEGTNLPENIKRVYVFEMFHTLYINESQIHIQFSYLYKDQNGIVWESLVHPDKVHRIRTFSNEMWSATNVSVIRPQKYYIEADGCGNIMKHFHHRDPDPELNGSYHVEFKVWIHHHKPAPGGSQ